jgi:hypothetical protein
MSKDHGIPYIGFGKPGEALKSFTVLCTTGEIKRYPRFWKEFGMQLFYDITDMRNQLNEIRDILEIK